MNSNEEKFDREYLIKRWWGKEGYDRYLITGQSALFLGHRMDTLSKELLYVAIGFLFEEIEQIRREIEEEEKFITCLRG